MLGTQEAAREIDRQHPLPRRQTGLSERRAFGLTGVVDQNPERAALCTGLRECCQDLIGIGNIGHDTPVPISWQAAGQLLQGFACAVEQGQPGTIARECLPNGSANSTPRAGDQCMAARQGPWM